MFISMNWISDFVDLSGLDIDELISRFTLSTAEVEEVIHKGRDVRGVVVGKIMTIENHPNSKKLHLLTVDVGDKVLDIVCGAPNVRVGMVVPVAVEGAQVGAMEIVKRPVAGYESCGMCCSESELGISADHSGLMELPCETALGTDIKKLYGIDDIIFEVENKSLTNRPDLWGHYGIAREFAALTGRELKPLPRYDCSKYSELLPVDIEIEDKEHCFRYSSIKVENVTAKLSPVEMRIRLFYCGMRAINLLADLTNYLMLEMGQPMHAFDLRKVDAVEIKRFDEPFEFETLDKVTRKIDEQTLMICSHGKPVAIAGIMGGYDSEISEDTSSLLIESANFDSVSIRKSAVRLNHRTDASARYEKTLDPEMTVPAIERYLDLLVSIDSEVRVISSLSDCWVKKYDEISLSFDKRYVDRYTGIDISTERIVKTLYSLGFTVRSNGDDFSVDVPSWRRTKDVTIKADIIEEITRIYGYDNFEIKTTLSPLAPVRSSQGKNDELLIKNLLADRFALHEVHSYLWSDGKKLKELGMEPEENVKLVNSINPDQIVLRRSIIPSLLCCCYDNRAFSEEFGIFEIGRVADGLLDNGKCNERKRLGAVLFSRARSEKELFLYVKDVLLELFSSARNTIPSLQPVKPGHAWQHPVNSFSVSCCGEQIGSLYTLMPGIAAGIDRKAACVCFELDMFALAEAEHRELRYREPSKLQGIDFDLSLLMDSQRPYSDIETIVKEFGSLIKESCKEELLRGCRLIDVYESPLLGTRKSVTIRLSFNSYERNLSIEEVQKLIDSLLAKLALADIVLKL